MIKPFFSPGLWVLTFLMASFGGFAQTVEMVKWPRVAQILRQSSDTTYILNFWATWCKPCVAELPHFEQIGQEFANKKVKIVLISTDFAKEINSRVVPFVQKQKLKNTVWLLNEPDANAWIDKISPKWSGAIPATLIFNNKRRKKSFFEQTLDSPRLRQELTDFL
ncbi:MAG: TlpA family protein disulfide reductase [Spirosomaceae bacterium]|jgi:thiol-disulfide isomerase/thioredoxin|nr:TlpA family protein disulfide reductase [Spirosomataceae bacterium]